MWQAVRHGFRDRLVLSLLKQRKNSGKYGVQALLLGYLHHGAVPGYKKHIQVIYQFHKQHKPGSALHQDSARVRHLLGEMAELFRLHPLVVGPLKFLQNGVELFIPGHHVLWGI